MKYLLTLIMPLMLMMTACEKTEYVVPNRTVVVDIATKNWVTYDNRLTYQVNIDLPEYDDYNNEEGAILVYTSSDGKSYEQIPQVIDGYAYSYKVSAGTLTLKFQNYDGSQIISAPLFMTVKIVLIDSNY